MQKSKTGKFSIFSSFDVKLEFLTSRVELTQFSVESSRVKLKICSTQLESSWKCEQLDFELSRIQNVNSKLDLTIDLLVSELKTELLLSSELRARLKRSYFVNFEREIFFLLIKIINLDEKLTTMIKTEEERQDENIVFKIDINNVTTKSWQIHDDEILI